MGWLSQAGQRLQFDGTTSPVKSLLFVVICIAWILPGLLGHQPWKPDEAYTFGLVYHMIQSGDWVVPTLAGEPFLEKPPIFFITAALFAEAFSWLLPLHDGARLATAFYIGLTLYFLALTARELYGERHERITIVILLGCLGLLVRAHQLITDVALLCGFAMSYYAFALARTKPISAGLLLGTGVGLGFLSKGLLQPGIIGITAALLPLLCKEWRQRNYVTTLAISVVTMLPWLLIWPWALYHRSPDLFHEWFFVENWYRFLGRVQLASENEPFFYFKILPWYAWPAWPIALWTLWRGGRDGLNKAEIRMPLLCFAVVVAVLSVAHDGREAYALPLLLPLSLLAGAGIDTLKRGAASALDWFGAMTFGLICLVLWVGWFALLTGVPDAAAIWIRKTYLPGYVMPFQFGAFLVALTLTAVYVVTIVFSRRNNRRAIINWTAGVTVAWLLATTIWLPMIDEGKSYKSMITAIGESLPSRYDCVVSRSLGEPQRALLEYYLGLVTQRIENGASDQCSYFLEQGTAADPFDPGPGWRKIWDGARPGDNSERFRLYQRIGTKSH
jgi:4-amino-4-deoxy-L-arabinose transferase-like glycosyltransferase